MVVVYLSRIQGEHSIASGVICGKDTIAKKSRKMFWNWDKRFVGDLLVNIFLFQFKIVTPSIVSGHRK